MRVSLNWLKELVDIPVDAETLAHDMTMLGLEIEAVERPGDDIAGVLIGEIKAIGPHPDADKLVVCQTDVGAEAPLQIVCGATNMNVGDRVPTATVGGALPGGFKIGKRKMRGVTSHGMMCSARELGLGEDHEGLLILDDKHPIGADAKPLLGLDDTIFEIEVTPNRGDWAGMIGVARELAALYKGAVRLPEIALRETPPSASDSARIDIEDAEGCPRYIGRVLTGARVAPSPPWLVRRLLAAGQRPINNVVDITNYVLLETGQPLHAFDLDRLAGERIVVRRAREGEKINTLDGETRTLDPEWLVIADAESPQAVAGVMGGGDSEVGESTTRILLESACFDPARVRKASRGLNLITESSQRFQRGADPAMTDWASRRAAQLLQDAAGAALAEGALDVYPRPPKPVRVTLRYGRANALLGTKIAGAEQRDMLERLGFEAESDDGTACAFKAPSWRHDVSRETDLIEEVARLHNYENIDIALPRVRPSKMVFAPDEHRVRAFRRHLAELGLTETFHWTFGCPEDVARAGLGAPYDEMVLLENPLSEKQAGMRTALIPVLLQATARNLHRGAERIAVFELGPVYRPAPGADLPEERMRVGAALAGHAEPPHWSQAPRPVDFHDAKGYVESILDFFGVSGEYVPENLGPFLDGQCATVKVNGEAVAWLGKARPRVLKAWDIASDVFLVECRLDALLALRPAPAQYVATPSFPPSLRDMAVVVGEDAPAGEIRDFAAKNGGAALRQIEIFDIYRGGQVPEGKKSVALKLVFQSNERTLTDKDTQKAWDKILRALEKQYGAALR